MHDIASQLVLKWARQGADHRALLTDDFTRLTLDTIALCAMDYRFNSFYTEGVHPFIDSMSRILSSLNQGSQIGPRLMKLVMPSINAQLKKDDEYMDDVAQELVNFRRSHPTEKKDLLNAMINGRDPKTGASMRDELIIANMRTFLVAGHETTSGLLSFAFANLLLKPAAYFAAQEEVDRVVGAGRIEPHHLAKLPYLAAVLRETLRLAPTAPAISRGRRPENKEDPPTIGGGKYEIPGNKGVLCLLGKIQRDPKVFGDDADDFRPERMLDESFNKLPKNAWRPFGTGLRACIGRAFAWQEALLVMALVLQNFTLRLDDPDYKMPVQHMLTIKPKDCWARVSPRPGVTALGLQDRLLATGNGVPAVKNEVAKPVSPPESTNGDGGRQRMTIIYGSNTGSCQALAQKLASEATQRGFAASVDDLDSAVDKIPADGQPVVVITASYEGQPPDNAARLVAWLETVKDAAAFNGTRFAVFGCGHVDWVSTYQRIPKLVDSLLAEHGATRIAERGESDASQRDIYGDFAKWTAESLWPALSDKASAELPQVEMELEVSTQQRAAHLQQKLYWSEVAEARLLTAASEPEKRHIRFKLPSDMSYQSGDYLAVLPLNPDESVRRVIRRFGLPWDATITIRKGGPTTLPTETPMSVFDLLRGYVELAQPATLNVSLPSHPLPLLLSGYSHEVQTGYSPSSRSRF